MNWIRKMMTLFFCSSLVYFQSCLDMLRKLRSEKQVLSSQVGQIFLSILPCHFSFGGSFQTFHTMGSEADILIGTSPCKAGKLPIKFLLQSSCNSLHWELSVCYIITTSVISFFPWCPGPLEYIYLISFISDCKVLVAEAVFSFCVCTHRSFVVQQISKGGSGALF